MDCAYSLRGPQVTLGRYVPVSERPFRFSVGLRPLEESAWLEFDAETSTNLAEKERLLAERRDEVFASRPSGDEGSLELRDEIVANLRRYHAGRDVHVDEGEHPLVSASRLVNEDLCVLVREEGEWTLQAACVCFPSRWLLADKIGRGLDAIHAPVPTYAEDLASPTRSVFDRLRPERPFWRVNWTLLDSPELFQPDAARQAPSGDLEDWFVRVERQTIRRLARTNAAVFTIRTYVESAAEVSRRSADFAPSLLRALDTAPTEVQVYKGWAGLADRLRDALS